MGAFRGHMIDHLLGELEKSVAAGWVHASWSLKQTLQFSEFDPTALDTVFQPEYKKPEIKCLSSFPAISFRQFYIQE